MKKIKILGAGPSGLSAAINLAKAGYKVDVFEKQSDVGKRFYGDLQGLENWSEKEDILDSLKQMNIKINFDYAPFRNVAWTNGSKMVEFNCKKPFFYLVKRGSLKGSLDRGLKIQAIKSGVNIHFRKTIPNNQADIIATGPIQNEIPMIAKGIIFKTKMQDIAISIINDKVAFKAYSYLLVTNGYGCMCSVVFDKLNKIGTCFEETKKVFSNMLELDIQKPKNVGGVGCFSIKNVFKKNGTLFIGEAAGLQDFCGGFGMRYALTSGFLAARSIINDEDYEKIAKKYFNPKLKAGLVNRFLTEKFFRRNDYSFIIERLKNIKDPFNFLYLISNHNFIQRLIYPFALSYMRKTYPRLRL